MFDDDECYVSTRHMRPDSLLIFWRYINHLLTYLLCNSVRPINVAMRYLTLYLTLCGLTGEPIVLWGQGFSGLIY